ncbi:MAG: ATP-binding protein [Anaerolineae bacterium]|nr:ATP-binding protein [Anaerolineae bacterium]
MENAAIGKVTATEKQPTTCNTLRFWVHRGVVIRPFDIVRVEHISKYSDNPSYTYAIVQDLEYITDSAGHLANYVSSDFGDLDAKPQNERMGTTIAQAEVLYNNQEIEMPVRDGAQVEWADVEGIKEALGLSAYQQPIPAGYICISNGEEVPIEVEAEYLLGPEGAHLNIAGISGLATKTSYVMFLLNSIQQRLSDKVAMVIFNVKGNDLLAIDEPNSDLTDLQRAEWKKCGLEPIPFDSVTYLYPYARRPQNGYTLSHVDSAILRKQQEEDRAFNYFYDVETARPKLALLFSDIDDPNSTMESVAHKIADFNASSWGGLKEEVERRTKKGSGSDQDISVMSWRKFSRLLRSRTENDLFTERATTQADKKRHKLIREAILALRPGNVLVVDVEPLPDYLQCLVFGDVIQTIYGIKLGDEDADPGGLGKVVIFADELNKYAPKTGDSRRTLTQNILEVTERGRSLGTVLFGAEQFRSGVHDRVLGNCSTNVYGRTSPVEIAKCPDYRYFPNAYKAAITRLPKGSLLLQHAVFKTSLVKVKFPFPSYHQPREK